MQEEESHGIGTPNPETQKSVASSDRQSSPENRPFTRNPANYISNKVNSSKSDEKNEPAKSHKKTQQSSLSASELNLEPNIEEIPPIPKKDLESLEKGMKFSLRTQNFLNILQEEKEKLTEYKKSPYSHQDDSIETAGLGERIQGQLNDLFKDINILKHDERFKEEKSFSPIQTGNFLFTDSNHPSLQLASDANTGQTSPAKDREKKFNQLITNLKEQNSLLSHDSKTFITKGKEEGEKNIRNITNKDNKPIRPPISPTLHPSYRRIDDLNRNALADLEMERKRIRDYTLPSQPFQNQLNRLRMSDHLNQDRNSMQIQNINQSLSENRSLRQSSVSNEKNEYENTAINILSELRVEEKAKRLDQIEVLHQEIQSLEVQNLSLNKDLHFFQNKLTKDSQFNDEYTLGSKYKKRVLSSDHSKATSITKGRYDEDSLASQTSLNFYSQHIPGKELLF